MFFVVIVQNDEITSSFGYTDYTQALAKYHTELAYRSEGRTSTMCMIIDRFGEVQKKERYSRNSD